MTGTFRERAALSSSSSALLGSPWNGGEQRVVRLASSRSA